MGLSNIELSSCTSECQPNPSVEVSYGAAVVSSCFHRFRLRPTTDGHDIRNYLCWPPLRAKELNLKVCDGCAVLLNQRIWPANCSLPMGFSWSLYFAQNANGAQLQRQPSLANSHYLSDRGKPWVVVVSSFVPGMLPYGNVGNVSNHFVNYSPSIGRRWNTLRQ